jgi:hypothetical protein
MRPKAAVDPDARISNLACVMRNCVPAEIFVSRNLGLLDCRALLDAGSAKMADRVVCLNLGLRGR